jgi:predicted O-methyltransferase YrrM
MSKSIAQLDLPRCSEEAVRALCYEGLRYRNQYYFDSMPVYLRMVNIAFHYGGRNILELGAGLSTALWARFANQSYAKVTTIDADFDPMRSYIESPELLALVDQNIRLVQGVTISSQQLRDFYGSDHEMFGGVSAKAIADTLVDFTRPGPQLRMDAVRDAAGSESWSAQSIYIPDNAAIRFPQTILDKLSPSGRFAKDAAFLDEHPLAPIDPAQTWDLIFFDSGEYSSCVEWLQFKDRIAVGGLAAFHDIFFPKSVKNFLPCAAILSDPNWRIVWLDQSTIQGLLIAQKLK